MIVYDFEVVKYDWVLCWLDTETRKMYTMHNDKEKLQRFYEHYRNRIWVGYNSRNYDQWIAKAILCDFNPYEMNDWIINKEQKGFMFSKLLNQFPILNYDCSVGFRGLKEIEAFMGHDIRETTVPFDIDRPLTASEIKEITEYCKHDVMETFLVFLETKDEFESHVGLIKEFSLPLSAINKTKAQISAMILGAVKKKWNDEFDISFPDTLELGQYEWLRDWYTDWGKNLRTYEIKLETNINGVPHVFGIGGLHGSRDGYFGEGYFLMADVASYYPAMMIEYGLLSRNVLNPDKYTEIRNQRLKLKLEHDAREYPRKIVLNSTFGACKDQYNALYDPRQSNNICIAGQLLLTDLLDKLDGKCELIQTNTDGVLLKLYRKEDKQEIVDICKKWSVRTRMDLDFEEYVKVIQKDVNNYILIPTGELYDKNGKPRWKSKGAYVKKLKLIDNDLPIVNQAVINYFIHNTPVEKTIMSSDRLIDFQKVTKISRKYKGGLHGTVVYKKLNRECMNCQYGRDYWGACGKTGGQAIRPCKYYKEIKTIDFQNSTLKEIGERINRTFASLDPKDGTLFKIHNDKNTPDKVGGTPECCFIDNSDITEKKIPAKLDKKWYIDLAKDRIKQFLEK